MRIRKYNFNKFREEYTKGIEFPFVAQVSTPVGNVIGYSKEDIVHFYVNNNLISDDGLKTMNLSFITDINKIDINAIQDLIDVWEEGQKITFSSDVALILKGEIITTQTVNWSGDSLIYTTPGGGGDDYYYYYYEEDDKPKYEELYPYFRAYTSYGDILSGQTFESVNTPGIVKLTTGKNINSIDDNTFSHLEDLEEFIFDSIGLMFIGENNLSNSNIKIIEIRNIEPPIIYDDIDNKVVVYVPDAALNTYKTSAVWMLHINVDNFKPISERYPNYK